MSTYEVKLEAREEIAEGTIAFHFSKPPGFSFKPGRTIEAMHQTLNSAGIDDDDIRSEEFYGY